MRSSVDSCCIYVAHLNPTLNGGSEMQCFERSDPIEMRDRIVHVLDFYTRLPHVYTAITQYTRTLTLGEHEAVLPWSE